MADRTLRTVLVGEDRSLGKTLTGVAGKGEHAGQRLSHAFSKLGSVMGGEVADVLTRVSDGLDEMGNKGHRIQALGGALAGVGAVLTGIGDKERAASQQLDQAIENTGNSADEFSGKIEETISQMEKFGYTAVQTKPALQTLVQATKDPTRAVELMGEVSDLAAAKHISLGSAAEAVARIIAGRGARTMAQFNVALVANADGTTNWEKTNESLAQQLSGQANASVSGFTGTLRHLKAEVEDQVALFGEKYGPSITTAGVAILAFGPIVSKGVTKLRTMRTSLAATATETQTAAGLIVGAEGEIATATTTTAGAVVRADATIVTANSSLLASMGRLTTGLGLLAGAALVLPSTQGGELSFMRELEGAFEDQTHSTDKSAKALLAWAATSKTAQQFGPFMQMLKDLKIRSDDVATAVSGDDATFDQFKDQLKQTGRFTDTYSQLLGQLHSEYRNTAGASEQLNRSVTKGGKSLQNEARQGATLKDALDGLSSSFDRLNGRTIDATEADLDYRDSLTELRKAFKGNNDTLDKNTVKGREHIRALFASIKAAQADSEATFKRTKSSEKARKAFEDDRAEIKRHLIALGVDRAEAQKLLDTYAKTPSFKKTKFDVEAEQAREKLDYLQNRLTALAQGTNVPVNVTLHSGRGVLQGNFGLNAEGTGSAAPGWSWVGERLPDGSWSPSAELVNFRGGEQVLNARDSARVTRGYADGTPTPAVHHAAPKPLRVVLDLGEVGRFRATLYGIAKDAVDDERGFRDSIAGMSH